MALEEKRDEDYWAAMDDIQLLESAVFAYEYGDKDDALACLAPFLEAPIGKREAVIVGETLGEQENRPVNQNGVWLYNVPEEPCDRNLIRRALDILRYLPQEKAGYGVYNLLEILKLVRQDLSSEDFSYLDFSFVSLYGVLLGHDASCHADFSGSKISMDNLEYADQEGRVLNIVSVKDGKYIVSVADNIMVHETGTKYRVSCMGTHRYKLALSPDGRYCCSKFLGTVREKRVWPEDAPGNRYEMFDPSAVCYSPDSLRICIGTTMSKIKEWDRTTG